MPVQDTRRVAHADNLKGFATLGDRIVSRMNRGIRYTRAELANLLSIPTATMSGRINDLLKAGRVKDDGKLECSITGRMVRGVTLN